jgi:archaetidylinositol phosphate synthase
MLTKLKQRVQRMLSSEAKAAHRIGLTPNKVTVIGFVFSILASIAYALTTPAQSIWLLVGVVLLMSSGFCDTLDGILARTYQQGTTFGGFLDSLLDRYSDVLIFAGIIVSGASIFVNSQFSLIITLAAIASSFMVSYTRARAEAAGIKMESIGIAERPERIIILAIASLAALFWLPALSIGMMIIAVLATITVLQRGLHVYKSLKKNSAQKENGTKQVKMVIGS